MKDKQEVNCGYNLIEEILIPKEMEHIDLKVHDILDHKFISDKKVSGHIFWIKRIGIHEGSLVQVFMAQKYIPFGAKRKK